MAFRTQVLAGSLLMAIFLAPSIAGGSGCIDPLGSYGRHTGFVDTGSSVCFQFFADANDEIVITLLHTGGGAERIAGALYNPQDEIINGMQFASVHGFRDTGYCTTIEAGVYTFVFGAFNADGGASYDVTIDSANNAQSGGLNYPLDDVSAYQSAALHSVTFLGNFGLCRHF